MYVAPDIIATFRAADLLGEAYGIQTCGNEGNTMPVGNGSCESPV